MVRKNPNIPDHKAPATEVSQDPNVKLSSSTQSNNPNSREKTSIFMAVGLTVLACVLVFVIIPVAYMVITRLGRGKYFDSLFPFSVDPFKQSPLLNDVNDLKVLIVAEIFKYALDLNWLDCGRIADSSW